MTDFNLNTLTKKLKKKYGSLRMADSDVDDKLYIKTGNKALDLVLGGGIAWGYMGEFAGFSQTGKTTILQILLANAQRDFGAVGIWIDREKAWFNKRAESLGVDTSNVIVIDPMDIPTVVEANQFVEDTLSGIPDDVYKFICIDSISAFAKTAKSDKSDMGKRALQLHDLFRMITKFTNNKTSVNFSNHKYYRPDVMFGDKTVAGGGEAPKYYTTYRIQLEDRKQILNAKENNAAIGNWIKATIIKTRTGPSYRSVVFPHFYESGIPELGGYARMLVSLNYAKPTNKTEFKSFKSNSFKIVSDDSIDDKVYNEFNIEELFENHPELIFDEYPPFNKVEKADGEEDEEENDEFELD